MSQNVLERVEYVIIDFRTAMGVHARVPLLIIVWTDEGCCLFCITYGAAHQNRELLRDGPSLLVIIFPFVVYCININWDLVWLVYCRERALHTQFLNAETAEKSTFRARLIFVCAAECVDKSNIVICSCAFECSIT